jgi:hypothetical protein
MEIVNHALCLLLGRAICDRDSTSYVMTRHRLMQ